VLRRGDDESVIARHQLPAPGATRPARWNPEFLLTALRVWAVEILVSGFNYYVLMKLIYEPAIGELHAHQVGMSTRIVYIFVFAWLLLRYARRYTTRDLLQAGILWLTLTLAFEWGGSILLQHRPVHEILEGWHIENGYMWPYVLVAYLTAVPLVGLLLRAHRDAAG
jgi:hypothetical protein